MCRFVDRSLDSGSSAGLPASTRRRLRADPGEFNPRVYSAPILTKSKGRTGQRRRRMGRNVRRDVEVELAIAVVRQTPRLFPIASWRSNLQGSSPLWPELLGARHAVSTPRRVGFRRFKLIRLPRLRIANPHTQPCLASQIRISDPGRSFARQPSLLLLTKSHTARYCEIGRI